MAHECFEDAEVARVLNEAFVCIKVDREERPDVDDAFMHVCQALTGGGGWPLTVVMTPDRRPFFAATYIPKNARLGSPGLLQLVPRITELWRTRRGELERDAERIVKTLTSGEVVGDARASAADPLPLTVIAETVKRLQGRFDPHHGGFGGAPKFPSPHVLGLLFRAKSRCIGDDRGSEAVKMATATLDGMRAGGICDQLGHGWHRYSVDERWEVPHFEKMLYDQAGITIALVEAYQVTGNQKYAEWALETIDYARRDLSTPEASFFFSAEDADSEGVEGKFYTWQYEQVEAVLGAEAAREFALYYGVPPPSKLAPHAGAAQHEECGPVLHLTRPIPEDRAEAMAQCRARLLEARAARPRPHRDENVLADWNSFMAVALCRTARALGDQSLAQRAAAVLDFVTTKMRVPSSSGPLRLFHHFKDGVASVPGILDDYAFTAWALCELYMTTFQPQLLDTATALLNTLDADFWDSKVGGYFFVSASCSSAVSSLPRRKDASDGAYPSGNSAALMALGMLAALRPEDPGLGDRARQLSAAFSETAGHIPFGYAQFVSAATDWALGPVWHVTVIAPDLVSAKIAAAKLGGFFFPRVVLSAELCEATKGVSYQACTREQCMPPVTSPDQVAALILC